MKHEMNDKSKSILEWNNPHKSVQFVLAFTETKREHFYSSLFDKYVSKLKN